MAAFGKLDTNVATLSFKLFEEQVTEEEHIDSNKTPDHPRPSRTLLPSRPPAGRPPHIHTHQTRYVTATQKKKKYPLDIKCWGCGRGHHLRDCPTTSLEMRQRIWEEYRQKRRDKNNTPSSNKVNKSDTAHSRQHHSPTHQHNHSNVASLHTDAAIAPTACDFTEYSMTNRRPEKANAVRHKATRAECRTTVHSHDDKHPTPTEPPRPPTQERSELVTSVTDWLIDSGATAHMTPSEADFNGTLTPFDSIVETANGGMIRVTHEARLEFLCATYSMEDSQ
jgi:hypothetical protein